MLNSPRVRAPQLPRAPSRWLNTDSEALSLQKGVVTLLDFFTHGCINCLHILPDLEWLERKYRGVGFRVIGVHSPKFDREQDAASVRSALERNGILHPVLLDADHAVRRAYAVRAWPTLVLVDAEGYIAGVVSGEGHRDMLDQAIASLLPDFAPSEPSVSLSFLPTPPDTPLRFPGKVLVAPRGDRLFIADTGYHRIVVVPLGVGKPDRNDEYKFTYIGDGEPGWQDGGAAQARFRAPQGMALSPDGNRLYVADTGNHLLRCVDLAAGTVQTVAGTGVGAIGAVVAGSALETDLNSPWDLALAPDGGALFVAMTGSHQIIRVDLDVSKVTVYAGSGREGRVDDTGSEAAFAQPSGLALWDNKLLVADSESSSIRAVTVDGMPCVKTLAGGDLFDFGWRDSDDATLARFQHPLGVAVDSVRNVYVADTYNHRIRCIDSVSGAVTTLAGDGERDVLDEPGGLSATGNRLYIADTNHHRIRMVDLNTGQLADLFLPGLCSPTLCFPMTTEYNKTEKGTNTTA